MLISKTFLLFKLDLNWREVSGKATRNKFLIYPYIKISFLHSCHILIRLYVFPLWLPVNLSSGFSSSSNCLPYMEAPPRPVGKTKATQSRFRWGNWTRHKALVLLWVQRCRDIKNVFHTTLGFHVFTLHMRLVAGQTADAMTKNIIVPLQNLAVSSCYNSLYCVALCNTHSSCCLAQLS